jgi:hypothetical protein
MRALSLTLSSNHTLLESIQTNKKSCRTVHHNSAFVLIAIMRNVNRHITVRSRSLDTKSTLTVQVEP